MTDAPNTIELIASFLRSVYRTGDVFEVRALKCRSPEKPKSLVTKSGYYTYDRIDEAAAHIAALDESGVARGIYVTLNPVAAGIASRADHCLMDKPAHATKDTEIVARKRLLVDLDPVRPKHTSSSDAELALAIERAELIAAALTKAGWPQPLIARSGNGAHLLYAIDLPVADDDLLKRVLAVLGDRFDDERVTIDRSVFNPSRITKVIGTMARKGEPTPERPHRRAEMVQRPELIKLVDRTLLERLAASAAPTPAVPPPPRTSPPRDRRPGKRFKSFDHTPSGVTGYLAEFGIRVVREQQKSEGTWLHLDRCPIVPECTSESGTDISVVVRASGAIGYRNQHNRGVGLGWRDVREALEPGYRAWSELRGGEKGDNVRPKGPVAPVTTPAVPVTRPATLARYKLFPTSILPKPLSSYVTASARALGCDEAFVLIPAIVALAACVGTTRRIMLKRAWCEPCVIWGATIAPSGSLKSPGLDKGIDPLREREAAMMRRFAADQEAYEAAKAEYVLACLDYRKQKPDKRKNPPVEPQALTRPRLIVSDVTVAAVGRVLSENPRGVVLVRDELGGWVTGFDEFKGGRGSDAAAWMQMHGARQLTIDRKGEKDAMHILRAAVSVCGTIQPKALRRVLGAQHLENGLAARLLCAMPDRRPRKWTDADLDAATLLAYGSVMDGLLALRHDFDGESAIDIGLTPGGKSAWVEFYNDFGMTQFAAGDGDVAAAFSKLEGYAARFALLIHLIRVVTSDVTLLDPNGIDEESIAVGVQMVRWFAAEAERVYAVLGASETDDESWALLEVIRSFGGRITVRDLMRASRRWRGSAEGAQRVLEQLVRAGLGRWEHVAPGRRGGPGTEVLVLLEGGDGDTTSEIRGPEGGSVTVTGEDEVCEWSE